jgi:hypothetical protein
MSLFFFLFDGIYGLRLIVFSRECPRRHSIKTDDRLC